MKSNRARAALFLLVLIGLIAAVRAGGLTEYLDQQRFQAVLDGEEEGFARVHVKKGTDKIVGATIVAAHAGDLISLFTLAMKAGARLGTITGTRMIFPYPTQAEVVKKAATQWRKTTLTEGKKKILKRWFAWAR